MLDDLLNIVKVLFYLFKVIEVSFVRTELALSDISFYLIKFR